jgi:hypothetical protein
MCADALSRWFCAVYTIYKLTSEMFYRKIFGRIITMSDSIKSPEPSDSELLIATHMVDLRKVIRSGYNIQPDIETAMEKISTWQLE